MNEEVKRQWVAALRGNDYTQARGQLHSTKGFCCLGVLCDLHGRALQTKGWRYVGPDTGYLYLSGFRMPAREVFEWAGIDSRRDSAEMCAIGTLAAGNDFGRPFTELADIIEEQL